MYELSVFNIVLKKRSDQMECNFNIPCKAISLLIYSGQYVSSEFLLEINLVVSFMDKETLNGNDHYYYGFSDIYGIL